MYFDYDDRYGCRVSEGYDNRSALQKAESKLEVCRNELLKIKSVVEIFDKYGWDAEYQMVLVDDVFMYTIDGCKPFFCHHFWMGENNRQYALNVLEKAQKEFDEAYDLVESLG